MPYCGRKTGVRMSMYQRAAQFAPFAALTGHGAAIIETARLTDSRIELSEYERSILDKKLAFLLQHISLHPTLSITHFVPDQQKDGGKYTNYEGRVWKWDSYSRKLIFDDNTSISLSNVIDIGGSIFKDLKIE